MNSEEKRRRQREATARFRLKQGIKPRQPTEVRFWSKVAKVSTEDCWLWIGTKTTSGYGRTEYVIAGEDRR